MTQTSYADRMIRGLTFAAGAAAMLATTPAAATGSDPREIINNWNLADCGVTDTAELRLAMPTDVTQVELWFRWKPNETIMAYTLTSEGRNAGSGNLVRGACDPRQTQWCIARVPSALALNPGVYTFRTRRADVCQNAGSSGHGFIRAYGDSQTTAPPPPRGRDAATAPAWRSSEHRQARPIRRCARRRDRPSCVGTPSPTPPPAIQRCHGAATRA